MDKLIAAVKKFGSNQPDPATQVARALDERDWRAYYLALEELEHAGRRQVLEDCARRGSSLVQIVSRLARFHAHFIGAGVAAVAVLWFNAAALRPVIRRLIDGAVERA